MPRAYIDMILSSKPGMKKALAERVPNAELHDQSRQ
jgi:hypothetical protein